MEARQDGEQVDDGPEAVGIAHERVLALLESEVGRNPSQDVVDDEDGRREGFQIGEVGVMVPKHEGHHAQDDGDEHDDIVEMAPYVRPLVNLDKLV